MSESSSETGQSGPEVETLAPNPVSATTEFVKALDESPSLSLEQIQGMTLTTAALIDIGARVLTSPNLPHLMRGGRL